MRGWTVTRARVPYYDTTRQLKSQIQEAKRDTEHVSLAGLATDRYFGFIFNFYSNFPAIFSSRRSPKCARDRANVHAISGDRVAIAADRVRGFVTLIPAKYFP